MEIFFRVDVATLDVNDHGVSESFYYASLCSMIRIVLP